MSLIDSVTVTNEFGTSSHPIVFDYLYCGIDYRSVLGSRSDFGMVIDFFLTVEH